MSHSRFPLRNKYEQYCFDGHNKISKELTYAMFSSDNIACIEKKVSEEVYKKTGIRIAKQRKDALLNIINTQILTYVEHVNRRQHGEHPMKVKLAYSYKYLTNKNIDFSTPTKISTKCLVEQILNPRIINEMVKQCVTSLSEKKRYFKFLNTPVSDHVMGRRPVMTRAKKTKQIPVTFNLRTFHRDVFL